jgi:hypothetical protein
MTISVIKKNGSKENFDIEKIHKVVSWSVNGLSNVSQSDIEINAKLNIIDGITTEQIHSVLIDSAANLINEETPDYQYVAGRLLNYQIRKNVWGGKNPPKLVDLIKKNVDLKFYEPKLLEWYSAEEINKIDEFINHEQDFHYTYCSIKQLCDKYLVKNQFTSELFETPQFRYIVASMTLFRNYSKKTRLSYIKKAYNYFSKFKINLATPQLAGLGTNNNSYASCFPGKQLIELNGYSKQISEISLNDCVLSHEGNYRKVIAKADKLFTGNLITLDTSSTFKDYFQSTEDHLIYSVKKIKCIRNSKCGSCNTKKAKPNYCFKKENP